MLTHGYDLMRPRSNRRLTPEDAVTRLILLARELLGTNKGKHRSYRN